MHTLQSGGCKIIAILLSWGLISFAHAQNEPYHGGAGYGTSNLASLLLACNTQRFSGGDGPGISTAKTAALQCSAFRFAGDSAGGFTTTRTNLLDCHSFLFTGDTAAGFSMGKTNLLGCNSFRFAGDTAAGFSSLPTQLLNCNLFRFAGNTGSGYVSGEYIKPRNFLGNDTSVYILCTDDTYNLLSLYNFEGITVNWNTALPAAATAGTYEVTGVTNGGCRDTAITVIKQELNTWTGTVSSDWHTAANWSNNNIPSAITHVIIPGGTAHPCVISNADAAAASVSGKLSGNLSVINNKNLLISGHCASLPAGQ